MKRDSRPCLTSPGAGRTPSRHGPTSTCKMASVRCSSRARDGSPAGSGRPAGRLGRTADHADGEADRPAHRTLRNVRGEQTGTLRPEVLSGLLPLAALPPGLRAPILQHGARVAARSAATPRGALIRRAGALGLTGFQRARTFLGWSRIRANPGAATAIAAVALSIMAATSATLITVTGAHADAARSGNPRGSAVPWVTASPGSAGTASPTLPTARHVAATMTVTSHLTLSTTSP